MKIALALIFASFAFGQATQIIIPLPALNTLSDTDLTCTIETLDSTGTVGFECKKNADAKRVSKGIVQSSTGGSLFSYDKALCMLWTEDVGKYRLQCGMGDTIEINGYLPTNITRSKRWHTLWW